MLRVFTKTMLKTFSFLPLSLLLKFVPCIQVSRDSIDSFTTVFQISVEKV